MHKELLTLYGRVQFPCNPDGARVDQEHVGIFNTEIATLGYTFGGVCIERMRGMARGDFVDFRKRLIADLTEITGADRRHQTLFARFPHSTPNQHEYLLERVIGHVQNEIGYEPKDFQVLSCGHVIDLNLFDLRGFGACPICQHQVDQIPWTRNRGNLPFKSLTPLKTLVFCDDGQLSDLASALLARNSSLSAAEKAFLAEAARRVPVTIPDKLFKETLPFVYRLYGREAVRSQISGATDVLRMLVHVSDPEKGDLSLAASTPLKISGHHIKDAMSLLEDLPQIAEDLLRHRGRWKIFARKAHVSKASFKRMYPRATAAFAQLLGDEKGIQTFGRRVEPLVREKRVGALAHILIERPGELLRKIDFMLRNAKGEADVVAVMEGLALCLPKATTKMLFEVTKYLEHRDQAVGQRVFLPKGATNKAKIVEDKRRGIPDLVLLRALGLIEMELQARLRRLPPLGRVYVDPKLRGTLIPFNRRGDSATMVPCMKGSRLPLPDAAEVVRLFVHWTGRDVDLSAVLLDEAFNVIAQVSYTNLSGANMQHSGDVQYAPNGASEFIDVDLGSLGKLAKRGGRYIAMSVISFSGDRFDAFPCFAGYMVRDGMKSGEVYEPESVALKFDLDSATRSYVPLALDIVEREIVYIDMAMGGGRHQSVTNQGEKFSAVARMIADLPHSKPTVYDVVSLHAKMRGTLVDTPEQADVVYQRDGLDIEAVMAMTA